MTKTLQAWLKGAAAAATMAVASFVLTLPATAGRAVPMRPSPTSLPSSISSDSAGRV